MAVSNRLHVETSLRCCWDSTVMPANSWQFDGWSVSEPILPRLHIISNQWNTLHPDQRQDPKASSRHRSAKSADVSLRPPRASRIHVGKHAHHAPQMMFPSWIGVYQIIRFWLRGAHLKASGHLSNNPIRSMRSAVAGKQNCGKPGFVKLTCKTRQEKTQKKLVWELGNGSEETSFDWQSLQIIFLGINPVVFRCFRTKPQGRCPNFSERSVLYLPLYHFDLHVRTTDRQLNIDWSRSDFNPVSNPISLIHPSKFHRRFGHLMIQAPQKNTAKPARQKILERLRLQAAAPAPAAPNPLALAVPSEGPPAPPVPPTPDERMEQLKVGSGTFVYPRIPRTIQHRYEGFPSMGGCPQMIRI